MRAVGLGGVPPGRWSRCSPACAHSGVARLARFYLGVGIVLRCWFAQPQSEAATGARTGADVHQPFRRGSVAGCLLVEPGCRSCFSLPSSSSSAGIPVFSDGGAVGGGGAAQRAARGAACGSGGGSRSMRGGAGRWRRVGGDPGRLVCLASDAPERLIFTATTGWRLPGRRRREQQLDRSRAAPVQEGAGSNRMRREGL